MQKEARLDCTDRRRDGGVDAQTEVFAACASDYEGSAARRCQAETMHHGDGSWKCSLRKMFHKHVQNF